LLFFLYFCIYSLFVSFVRVLVVRPRFLQCSDLQTMASNC